MNRPILEQPPSLSAPSIQWKVKGQGVKGLIVDIQEPPDTDFSTGEIIRWPSGEVKTCKRVELYVTDTKDGIEAASIPVVPDELVSLWVRGGDLAAWRTAVYDHGPVKLGDGLSASWVAEAEPSNPKHHKRKIKTFRFWEPTPDMTAAIQAVNDIHQSKMAQNRADAPVLHTTDSGGTIDDEPF